MAKSSKNRESCDVEKLLKVFFFSLFILRCFTRHEGWRGLLDVGSQLLFVLLLGKKNPFEI